MATTRSDSSGTSRLSPVRARQDDDAGLGELLRGARERRGLTLDQIASETKISRRHLEALELDNLTAVPGGFYRRAEVRAFARAVDLDQTLALARLERTLERPVVREPASNTTADETPPASRRGLLLVLGVGVAASFVALLMSGRMPGPEQEPRNEAAAGAPRRIVPADSETGADSVVQVSRPTPLDPDPIVAAPTPGPPASAAAAPPVAPSVVQGASPQVASSPSAQGPDVPSPLPSSVAAPVSEPVRITPSAGSNNEIVVTTQPTGARVTVDGIGWGSAPVTIRFLPAGSKRIRVIKDGYRSEERVVRVVEGQQSTLEIQLHAAP